MLHQCKADKMLRKLRFYANTLTLLEQKLRHHRKSVFLVIVNQIIDDIFTREIVIES